MRTAVCDDEKACIDSVDSDGMTEKRDSLLSADPEPAQPAQG